MEKLTIKISDYPSKYFPVMVEWKTSDDHSWNSWKSNVFETEQQASDYIFGKFGNIPYRLIDTRQKPKRKALFKRGADIPKAIRNRTYYNMKHYYLDLYDAFKEAVSALYHIAPKELQEAWYNEDFREYIPNEYVD